MITKMRIEGMHCHSCKALIEEECREIPGVESCEVNMEDSMLTLTHADDLDVSRVTSAISKLGSYHVALV